MRIYGVIAGIVIVAVAGGLWLMGARVAKAPISPIATTTSQTTAASTTDAGGGSVGGAILPYGSGVKGTVTLGPTCPVERIPPDPSCADKPYATAVVVYRKGAATPFLIGNSDATGAFHFALPPGVYTLSAGGTKMMPRCTNVDVVVAASGYTQSDISCDTGIR